MKVRLSTRCALISGPQPEAVFGAVLQLLLKARLDLRLDEGSNSYEEDVNAYLGGVLVSYIDPEFLCDVSKLLARHDVDVYSAVDKAMPDKIRVYRIYKANADDLLISRGIFRPASGQVEELGRIKEYYACASECQKRIYGKPTALAEIQAKLSDRAERYLAVLGQLRTGYLHFVQQVSTEELADFSRRLDSSQAA